MKKSILLATALVALAATPAFAATKTYQVTGPVTAMTADTITVEKGSEKWEIARGTAGVPADVKVGSKVTVQYMMTAESVSAKSTGASSGASLKSSSSAKPGMGSASGSSASSGAASAAGSGSASGTGMQPPMAAGSSGASTASQSPESGE